MRQALTILLPLLAPTFFYIWLKSRNGDGVRKAMSEAPWAWLAGAGGALVAVLLVALTLTSGGPTDSVYRPARVVDGAVVPGAVVPRDDAGSAGQGQGQ